MTPALIAANGFVSKRPRAAMLGNCASEKVCHHKHLTERAGTRVYRRSQPQPQDNLTSSSRHIFPSLSGRQPSNERIFFPLVDSRHRSRLGGRIRPERV